MQRIVHLARLPQVMQQHRQLARDGDLRTLAAVLAALRREFLPESSQIAVWTEQAQDVVRRDHQQTPQRWITVST